MQHKQVKHSANLRFALLLALVALLTLGVLGAGAAPFNGQIDGQSAARPNSGRVQSYVVLMEGLPLVAYDGNVAGLAATKIVPGQKLDMESAAVRAYQSALRNQHMRALQGAGLAASAMKNEYTVALNGFSALMTPDQAEAMARQPGVLRVSRDTWRQKTTDASPGFLGINGPGEAWDMGYDGEGVVVGVIDSGIWPEHPSFADDGSYPEPPITLSDEDFPVCDFGNMAHNANDADFECQNKLIGARQMLETYRALIGADPDEFDSARDDDGHGTHTASTAAGNMDVAAAMLGIDRGMVSGIAPRAHVVAYKGLGNLGGFGSDLAAAIDQAVADGVDVINYSVGGGASLTGEDDLAYLFAAQAGVFVATSAGNSGPAPLTIGGPASVPWLTSVGASTQPRSFQGTVTLGNGMEYTGVSITEGVDEAPLVDAANAGGDLCVPGTLDEEMVDGAIVLCRRGAIARVDKSLAVYEAGGVGMIMYENSNDGDLASDPHWVPSVHVYNTEGLAIKAYIAGQPYSNNLYMPAVRGGNGTAGTPIPPAMPTAMITGEQLGVFAAAPSMTAFSSRGPNPVAMDIIKPDITAPGIQILAGNSPFPDPGQVPGELFMAIAGTSMSSPHVAGALALIKDAHPDWSAAAAKSALMTSSYQDVVSNDQMTQATPFEMGAGHLNPGKPGDEGSSFQPGLVYDAGFNDYLAFLCTAGPEVFANAAATCAALEGLGYSTDPSDLNLASIAIAELAGSQTVVRYVTSVDEAAGPRTYTVSVEEPAGYMVTVNPTEITLEAGETAMYEVTISNETAPVDEWRFGSLTWSDGDMIDVFSPIAVKGALIGVPGEIEGSGVDDGLSFDVNFGYTGEYNPNAHGLEPADIISDTVVQDPDQEFDPEDGFSTEHEVELSGAALFRLVMTQDMVGNADADIDIFVFDPDGNEIASSTNGGTDEQIDLLLPADGTYTIFVHGWQTAQAEPLPYDLFTWTVSATPGGNMMIDDAPGAAAIATSGTVDVSWTGATDGEWHLGAISHANEDGLLALTVINVDNR